MPAQFRKYTRLRCPGTALLRFAKEQPEHPRFNWDKPPIWIEGPDSGSPFQVFSDENTGKPADGDLYLIGEIRFRDSFNDRWAHYFALKTMGVAFAGCTFAPCRQGNYERKMPPKWQFWRSA